MKLIKVFIFLLFFFGLACKPVLSQNNSKSTTLTSVLKKYSLLTGTKLSYSSTLTNKVLVRNLQIEGRDEKALKFILKGTGFEYKKVGKNLYVIIKSREQPKKKEIQKERKSVIVKTKIPKDTIKMPPTVVPTALMTYYPFYRSKNDIPKFISIDNLNRDSVELPHLAIKTNMLYDATLSISFGAELLLDKKYTIDISATYNFISYTDIDKMKFFLIQPEIRYWNTNAFSGSFWAAHLHYGIFNWCNKLPFGIHPSDSMKKYRYEGWVAGIGVGYGYQWKLSDSFFLEAELGIGYSFLKYEKYKCIKCGTKIEDNNKNYVGPTKAALSLIYTIK